MAFVLDLRKYGNAIQNLRIQNWRLVVAELGRLRGQLLVDLVDGLSVNWRLVSLHFQ